MSTRFRGGTDKMGEDFKRKQDKQFKCLQDRHFERQFSPDLFAAIPPAQQDRILALAKDAKVQPGDCLWADFDTKRAQATLRHGDAIVAEVHGEQAAALADKLGGGGYVRVVAADDDIVEGQVCPCCEQRERQE